MRHMSIEAQKRQAEKEIAAFVAGRESTIGTRVRYFPVRGEPEFEEFETTGEPYILGGHTAVVQLPRRHGPFALSNIEKV